MTNSQRLDPGRMSRLLDVVQASSPVPQYVQIAPHGRWESAVRLAPEGDDAASLDPGSVDETVAAEIFYRLASGRLAFAGIPYSTGLRRVTSPTEFVNLFIGLAGQLLASRLDEAVAMLGRELNSDSRTYAFDEPEHLELGVIDYWKSVGSVVIWRRNAAEPVPKQVTDISIHNEALLRNRLNHIAVEFAYRHPAHWLGVQVSDAQDGGFELNMVHLQQLVELGVG